VEGTNQAGLGSSPIHNALQMHYKFSNFVLGALRFDYFGRIINDLKFSDDDPLDLV